MIVVPPMFKLNDQGETSVAMSIVAPQLPSQ